MRSGDVSDFPVHRFSLAIATVLLAAPIAAQEEAPWYQPLIELYESTNGEDWFRNENWLDEEVSPCQWYGVICNGPFGEMTALILPDNNLDGTLPESLLNGVGFMNRLNLRFNRLRGPIPNPDRPPGLGPGGIPTIGPERISYLDLSYNQLTGSLPEDLASMGLDHLDLSYNRLSGVLPTTWGEDAPGLERLILSGNSFEGGVPESWAAMDGTEFVNLSGNALAGDMSALFGMDALEGLALDDLPDLQFPDALESWPDSLILLSARNSELTELPQWFAELSLFVLDLAENDLGGTLDSWPILDASQPQLYPGHLDISHNNLTGALPEALFEREFNSANLCWNDFELPSDERVALINDWQDGSSDDGELDFSLCNAPAQPMGLAHSGLWHRPDVAGAGYSLMQLDSGEWILYAFEPGSEEGGQVWTLEQTAQSEVPVEFRGAVVTGQGSFDGGVAGPGEIFRIPWFQNRHLVTPLAGDRLAFDSIVPRDCLKCRFPEAQDRRTDSLRHTYHRLTQLAGSTCQNSHPMQGVSGVWYRPEVDAAGLVLQVTPDGRGVLYWATYLPEGHADSGQAWVVGVGRFEGADLVVDEVLRPVIDADDALAIESWGTMTLSFEDESSAQLQWTSSQAAFPDGTMALERLARARLSECH